MFKKLKRASKQPAKYTFDISVAELDHLPQQYGKARVVWCRGDQRSGHHSETSPVHVTNGSARFTDRLSQTMTLYRDPKGTLDSKKYELKVLQSDPAEPGEKLVVVASLSIDMAQYAHSPVARQDLKLRLPVKENPAWSALHGDVLLRIAVECRPAKVQHLDVDDISVASGLTSEASTVQEQDLSGFEAVSQSRRWTPAQSEQQARAAGDPARSVQVEEDRQREQLFGKTKQPPAAAAAPQSPGQVSAGRAAPPSAPTPNKSVAKPPAKQQAPEPIVSKMSEKLPEAVNATEDPQWSMTAVDAALNLDREEEIIALREECRTLETRMEELQASYKARSHAHQQQVDQLKSKVTELESAQQAKALSRQSSSESEQYKPPADTSEHERELRMAKARIIDLEGQLCMALADVPGDENDALLREAEEKLVAAQACILQLQEQLITAEQAVASKLAQQEDQSAAAKTSLLAAQVQELQATLAVERGAAAKTLAGLEQQLAADETARMSRTLSQDLGLSASTVQALQEAHTIRVSREHERTAAKHQVTSLEVELEQIEAELAAERARSRERIDALEAENKSAHEKVGVLEAHLDQLIAQVQHADKGQSLAGELERVKAALERERDGSEAQAQKLREVEAQLDALGSELLDARAAAREQATRHEAGMAELQHQVDVSQGAVQRGLHLEAEVQELESALAAERASASDNRSNMEAQVEALQAAVSASMARASVADAFTATTPRASQDLFGRSRNTSTTGLTGEDQPGLSAAPAALLSEEEFLEQPRAIALHSQLSVLRRTVTALHKSQTASEQGFALRLDQERQDSSSHIADLESRLQRLSQSTVNAEVVKELEQQLQQADEQLQHLSAQLEEANRRAARAEGHAADTMRALQDSADYAEQQRSDLAREASDMRSTIQALQSSQAVLESGFATQVQKQSAADRSRIVELEAALKVAQAKADKVPSPPHQARNGLLGTSAQAEPLLRELAEVGRQLAGKDATVRQLESDLEQARQEVAGANAARVQLENELAGHRADAEELLGKFEDAQQLSAYVSTELDSLHAQLAAAKAENAALSKHVELLRTSQQVVGESPAEDQAQLLRQLAQAQHANEALQQELEALKRDGKSSAATDRAVRLATAQADVEITRLKSACSDLEQRALSELNEMHDELLDMREACYKLEIALEESETKREKLRRDKNIVEQQLQVTAGDLMEVERALSSVTSSTSDASWRTGVSRIPGRDAPASPLSSGASSPRPEAGTPAGQADAVMLELVTKKMELAELHEQHLKQGRELRWAQQQALATEAKLAKLEAIIFSKAATPKPPTAADIQISGLIPAAHA